MTGEVHGAGPARRKPPTLYDVATLAGVSHQTVSRLVKGHTNIGPDLRERVEAAIDALAYKPNMAARSLATSRTHRIGALVYDILEVGPSKIMQGASAGAREAGYLLDIVSLDPNDDITIQQSISLINQNELAGIIAFAPTDAVLSALSTVPFSVPVLVESETTEVPGMVAPTLNEQGIAVIVEHLVSLGHRRFFYISGPTDWLSARSRKRAYSSALRDHGLSSVGSIEGDWTAASGYAAAVRMPLDLGVTALVVANDQMALGAISALVERGVSIPEHLSVSGFDDIPESRFLRPPLTTVSLDFDRQGRMAVERLLAMIAGEPASTSAPIFTPELKVRASVGPPPPKQ